MADTIQDINSQRIISRNDQSRKSLQENPYPDVRTLQEADFITHFLPAFSGDISNIKEVLAAWATIAGDLSRPVQLIDPLGVAVALVPPVTSSYAYRPVSKRAVNIEHDVTAARKGSVPLGETYLLNSLSGRLSDMLDSGDQSEDEKKWIALLERYGKSPVKAQVKASAAEDPEFEY